MTAYSKQNRWENPLATTCIETKPVRTHSRQNITTLRLLASNPSCEPHSMNNFVHLMDAGANA
eukprot:313867-Amphidinium_carterae.1